MEQQNILNPTSAIILILIMLIMIPIISKKVEKNSKTLDEWEKIREYGNKINEKTRNKKN